MPDQRLPQRHPALARIVLKRAAAVFPQNRTQQLLHDFERETLSCRQPSRERNDPGRRRDLQDLADDARLHEACAAGEQLFVIHPLSLRGGRRKAKATVHILTAMDFSCEASYRGPSSWTRLLRRQSASPPS